MHWDQNIIFIIIAAIIGISRLVSRISEESKKQSQRRRQPPQRPPPPPQLQQPTKIAPPQIKPVIVPAEASEPGAWIAQEQAQTGAATKLAIARADDQPSVRASADAIWKRTLRSPEAVRTAIVLREIFGPPRGVQSSNFVFETM